MGLQYYEAEWKEFQIVFLYCFLYCPVESYDVTSLYQAQKVTGPSLCSLINAAEKGNFKITRRRDKKEFLISWGVIHNECFEIRKMKRKEEERKKDLEEWQKELSKKEWFIKLQEEERKRMGHYNASDTKQQN